MMNDNNAWNTELDEDQQRQLDDLRDAPSFADKKFEFDEGDDRYEWRDN